jgi:hypothetical protein
MHYFLKNLNFTDFFDFVYLSNILSQVAKPSKEKTMILFKNYFENQPENHDSQVLDFFGAILRLFYLSKINVLVISKNEIALNILTRVKEKSLQNNATLMNNSRNLSSLFTFLN